MPVFFACKCSCNFQGVLKTATLGKVVASTRHPESCKNATTWWQIWQKQAKSLRLAFNTLFGGVVGCKQTPLVQKSHPRVGKMHFSFHKCKFSCCNACKFC